MRSTLKGSESSPSKIISSDPKGVTNQPSFCLHCDLGSGSLEFTNEGFPFKVFRKEPPALFRFREAAKEGNVVMRDDVSIII